MTKTYVACLAAMLYASGCGHTPPAAQKSARPVTGEPVADSPHATPPPAPAAGPSPSLAASQPQPALDVVRIPSGTLFRVRLEQSLDTRRNRAGDRFSASLTRSIVIGGAKVVPRGAQCAGHLVEVRPSGRFKGRALLALRLDSFELNGRRYAIRTGEIALRSGGHKKRNLLLIGGGAGAGSAIGAVAGGAAGALIGAGAGGAAGTVGAGITGRKHVRLPAETALAFALRTPVSIESVPKPT